LKKYSHSRDSDRETRAVAQLAGSGRENRSTGNAPRITLGSCSNGRQNINGRSQIVDERCEAKLSPDIVEALHQEGALVHPLLDATEGMLNDLAMPIEFRASPSGELASIYSFE
jgi:hypothetical protein